MRSLLDAAGRWWDVMVGKESWGTLVLLFSAREGGEVRKSVLAAETAFDAARELDALSDDELRERLAGASPWT